MINAISSLVGKDLREHLIALILLMAGALTVLGLMLAQNSASEFSMNTMQVVRLALMSTLPLIALIVGNRLIVREYMEKTQLFVEALPIGPGLPLLVKYLTGLAYFVALAILIVLLTSLLSESGDDIDNQFAGLVLLKTLALVTLLWSIVFCFSLCGRLRLLLYVFAIGVGYFFVASPSIDESKLGPFALLDSDLFAFERDIVPWADIAQTFGLAAIFAGAGFALALINEGSIAERLAKPMNRRDYAALGFILLGGLGLFDVLHKQSQNTPYILSGKTVIRTEQPPLAIRYEREDLRERGQAMLDRLGTTLKTMKQTLGLPRLPKVRIWMEPETDPDELKLWTTDGVVVHANFAEYDFYENSILDTVTIHGIFQELTSNRAVFEPNHWITDGIAHWWGRSPLTGTRLQIHDDEALARAVIALRRSPLEPDLITNFQMLADSIGHLSAETLAYSAVMYLEQKHGTEIVHELGREFLARPVATNMVGTVRDRIPSSRQRVESIIGISWPDFMREWREWLQFQARRPGVARLVDLVPTLRVNIDSVTDANGYRWLETRFAIQDGDRADSQTANSHADSHSNPANVQTKGLCVLKHDQISPTDDELWLNNDIRHEMPCESTQMANRVTSPYAAGDRAYLVVQFEHPAFHWPLMLRSRRLTIQ